MGIRLFVFALDNVLPVRWRRKGSVLIPVSSRCLLFHSAIRKSNTIPDNRVERESCWASPVRLVLNAISKPNLGFWVCVRIGEFKPEKETLDSNAGPNPYSRSLHRNPSPSRPPELCERAFQRFASQTNSKPPTQKNKAGRYK